MRRPTPPRLSSLCVVALLALPIGCSASSGKSSGAGGGGGACATDCGKGGSVPVDAIAIDPPSAALVVVNGQATTQAFKATLNGADVTASVAWSYARPDVGTIAADGTFTPTGKIGGSGGLTARLGDKSGSATVSVTVQTTVSSIDPSKQSALDAPGGAPDLAMKLVYPNDGTVFPLGVLAPELQWNGTAPTDVFKVELVESYYHYTAYTSAPPPSRAPIPEDVWTAIEASGAGPETDPLALRVRRLAGGTAYAAVTETLHVAQGALHGSVYYWELPDTDGGSGCGPAPQNGRILRIKAGSTKTDAFFDAGDQCFGCHTVSRDGKTLAAEFQKAGGPLYTLDLGKDPAVYGAIAPGAQGGGDYTFSAFNPDGTRLLASANQARTLAVLDAKTGKVLMADALAGKKCGEPAWSPDGKRIAAVCGLPANNGWTFDQGQGDLVVADATADGASFSNAQTIVSKEGGQGRPAYPSFSPDSAWLAFGRPTAGARSTDKGQLWLVGVDGANARELVRAESGKNNDYDPVFSPLRGGGYAWIAFVSRRDYGNELVGADKGLGVPLGRQQLWVAAIDDPPTAADPSHPAFYLRGQDLCQKSENAYFALDPCKSQGDACASGVDCCGGHCVKDANDDAYHCGEEPGCSGLGNACKTASDCCDASAQCTDGYCGVAPPK